MIGGISSSGGVRAPKKRSKPRGKTCIVPNTSSISNNVELSDFAFATTGDFSFSTWIKPSSYNATNGIMVQGSKSNSVNFTVSNTSATARYSFSINVGGAAIVNLATANDTAPAADRWAHVVVSVDRSSASDSKIYINGEAVTMSTQTIADTTTSVDISGSIFLCIHGIASVLNGRMKEFTAYDKALSAKEVSAIYQNKASSRFERSKLGKHMTVHLTMGDADGASGTTITDLSGNGRNGTLNGTVAFAQDSPS
jgi:hypothetical protein